MCKNIFAFIIISLVSCTKYSFSLEDLWTVLKVEKIRRKRKIRETKNRQRKRWKGFTRWNVIGARCNVSGLIFPRSKLHGLGERMTVVAWLLGSTNEIHEVRRCRVSSSAGRPTAGCTQLSYNLKSRFSGFSFCFLFFYFSSVSLLFRVKNPRTNRKQGEGLGSPVIADFSAITRG